MNLQFQFKTDATARAFCDAIIMEMIRLFGFSAEEAVGRINRQWSGNDFAEEEIDLRYHEDPFFWANDIVFGSDSCWWNNPPGLKPKPYP